MVKIEDVLHNQVREAHYCDHIIDNAFLDFSLKKTNFEMSIRAYTPVGVYLDPDYEGFCLCFKNIDGEDGWVHVSFALFMHWLEEKNLLPPADDAPWDWEFFKNYYWANGGFKINVDHKIYSR